jgi:VanZ family protein
MTRTRLRNIFWIGSIFYWCFLCVLTHLPPSAIREPQGFWLTDKQAHFIAYFVLSFSVGITLMVTLPGRRWIPLFVIALAMAYGAIDERTQPMFGRDCELGDWVADTLGSVAAAAGLFVVSFFIRPRPVSVGRQLIGGFDGTVPPSAAEAQ